MLTRRDFIKNMLAGGLALNLTGFTPLAILEWKAFAGLCPPSWDRPDIRVLGFGSIGVSAVKQLIQANLKDVPYYYTLRHRLFLGRDAIRKPSNRHDSDYSLFRQEIELSPAIELALKGCDLAFLVADMENSEILMMPGIAGTLKGLGASTIAVVSMTANVEKKGSGEIFLKKIEKLKEAADSLILVPNPTALPGIPPNTSEALHLTVKSLIEAIGLNQFIALDFKDFKDLFSNNLLAIGGSWIGFGEHEVLMATQTALSNLLEYQQHITRPQNVFVHYSLRVKSSEYLEYIEARKIIEERLGEVIVCAGSTDETLGATTRVTILTFDSIS